MYTKKGFAIVMLAFLVSAFGLAQHVNAEIIDKSKLDHDVSGGEIVSFETDETLASLLVDLNAKDDGMLSIDIPREFMDSRLGDKDDSFFVLVDGQEVIAQESKTKDKRTLVIPFDKDTETIEIIGTSLDVSSLVQKSDKKVSSQKPMDETVETTPPTSQQEDSTEVGGGGCLIATAAYGTELSEQVQKLRETRSSVMSTESGTAFMNSFHHVYYSFSPYIADFERQNPLFKEFVRVSVTPMLFSLSILDIAKIDSEFDMLLYGSSVLALNASLYVVAPLGFVFAIRKYAKKYDKSQV